jgi:hypothetical protein
MVTWPCFERAGRGAIKVPGGGSHHASWDILALLSGQNAAGVTSHTDDTSLLSGHLVSHVSQGSTMT